MREDKPRPETSQSAAMPEDKPRPANASGRAPCDLSLLSLQLFAADGAEEELQPVNGDELFMDGAVPMHEPVPLCSRIRVPLPPGSKHVTLHAKARSRHATVRIYRWHAAADENSRRCVEILNRTMCKPVVGIPLEHVLLVQLALRKWLARRKAAQLTHGAHGSDASTGDEAASQSSQLACTENPPHNHGCANKLASLTAPSQHPSRKVDRDDVPHAVRVASARWARVERLHDLASQAQAIHQTEQVRQTSSSKTGAKGSNKGTPTAAVTPPPVPADEARAVVLPEHEASLRASVAAIGCPGGPQLLSFLRANLLALVQYEHSARTAEGGSEAAGREGGALEAGAFEEALWRELGMRAGRGSTERQVFDALYRAMGLPTATEVEGGNEQPRVNLRTLCQFLLPAVSELSRECTQRLSLYDAMPDADATAPEDHTLPLASVKERQALLRMYPEVVATFRVVVVCRDLELHCHRTRTYEVHVYIAPPITLPPIPPPLLPIMRHLLLYFGDLPPAPRPPTGPNRHDARGPGDPASK